MPFEFSPSADKHGVPHQDAVHAVLHHAGYADLPSRRPGEKSFMFVDLPHPQAMRYIEVGVTVDGRGNRRIFHAMEVTDPYRHIVPRDECCTTREETYHEPDQPAR